MAKHDWDGEGYGAPAFNVTRYGGSRSSAKIVQNPSGSGYQLSLIHI